MTRLRWFSRLSLAATTLLFLQPAAHANAPPVRVSNDAISASVRRGIAWIYSRQNKFGTWEAAEKPTGSTRDVRPGAVRRDDGARRPHPARSRREQPRPQARQGDRAAAGQQGHHRHVRRRAAGAVLAADRDVAGGQAGDGAGPEPAAGRHPQEGAEPRAVLLLPRLREDEGGELGRPQRQPLRHAGREGASPTPASSCPATTGRWWTRRGGRSSWATGRGSIETAPPRSRASRR